MSRILAIDYGKKRTGIAVTDPMQIIASGLTTVPTHGLMDFLLDYVRQEKVERIVIGHPKQMNNEGFTFVEVLCACPTNWGMTPVEAVGRIRSEMIPYYPLGNFRDFE